MMAPDLEDPPKMSIPRYLTAVLAALAVLALLGFASCDALNPALVGQLGGNTGGSGPEPTGSIILAINNQRPNPVEVSYSYEMIQPGGGVVTGSVTGGAPIGTWGFTFDCNTSQIAIASIANVIGGTAAEPEPLEITFQRPALQCGSVIFINVPAFGSPTADLLP
jgi:hypothetical protein